MHFLNQPALQPSSVTRLAQGMNCRHRRCASLLGPLMICLCVLHGTGFIPALKAGTVGCRRVYEPTLVAASTVATLVSSAPVLAEGAGPKPSPDPVGDILALIVAALVCLFAFYIVFTKDLFGLGE